VLLLTGAALGDRFGRRRLLASGVAIFTERPLERRWRRRSLRWTLLGRCRVLVARS
jgi:hypothetical protein